MQVIKVDAGEAAEAAFSAKGMKIVLRIEKAKMLTSLFTIFILKSICLFYRENLRLVSLLINIWQGKSPVEGKPLYFGSTLFVCLELVDAY